MDKVSLIFVFTWINCYYVASYNVTLLRDYDMKVCHNEPSCHVAGIAEFPSDRRTLRKRDCMCDSKCVEYRDCCLDSDYYKELEQNTLPTYSCPATSKIYMKTDCPPTWLDQQITLQCERSETSLHNGDVEVIVPVTNVQTNITFGNRYCALCHGETEVDYAFWSIKPLCGEAPSDLNLPEYSGANVSPVRARSVSSGIRSSFENHMNKHYSDNVSKNNEKEIGSEFINALLKYVRRRKREITKLSVDYNKYALIANEIWKVASFNADLGYFVSRYEGKNFICEFSVKLPAELESNVRPCIPNLIEDCANNDNVDAVQKCKLYTSIIFNKKDNKVYRNKDCAVCNNVAVEYLTGCPIVLRQH